MLEQLRVHSAMGSGGPWYPVTTDNGSGDDASGRI